MQDIKEGRLFGDFSYLEPHFSPAEGKPAGSGKENKGHKRFEWRILPPAAAFGLAQNREKNPRLYLALNAAKNSKSLNGKKLALSY